MSLTESTSPIAPLGQAEEPVWDQLPIPLLEIQSSCAESPPADSRWARVFIIEDDSSRSVRRTGATARPDGQPFKVQMHGVQDAEVELLHSHSFLPSQTNGEVRNRIEAAVHLLQEVDVAESALVVANSAYGCNRQFLEAVMERGFDFAVELRPSTSLRLAEDESEPLSASEAAGRLGGELWNEYQVVHGTKRRPFRFCAADAGWVRLTNGVAGRLIVAHPGGVSTEVYRGTFLTFTSSKDASIGEILQVVPWTRWIREHVRSQERAKRGIFQPILPNAEDGEEEIEVPIPVPLASRANLTASRRRDQNAALRHDVPALPIVRRGALPARTLNVVELFAGVGGMGLGFLMARNLEKRYRVIHSAELEPIYAKTLQINHEAIEKRFPGEGLVPKETVAADLTKEESLERAQATANAAGGTDVMVGGPPCQGFSAANRNSWSNLSSDNPNNLLVDVFLNCVHRLQPKVFVMENVQGIMWTSKAGRREKVSVADDLHGRLEREGYLVFRDLLDAAWYGVPQHRTRYFVIGIHRDLGYTYDDFDASGPFPARTHGEVTGRDYVTVRDAVADLPLIGNGHRTNEMAWTAPPQTINPFLQAMREDAAPDIVTDHITSTHAPYVLERYAAIPQGGNWQNIQERMTNYAAIERTHSNIYRRLSWNEPTVTMGHYRKSMLIHPSQDRGLSLREAMRLQSFPDWVRFAGSEKGVEGGLVHKQQQLANAVCPLVLRAIAEEIARL